MAIIRELTRRCSRMQMTIHATQFCEVHMICSNKTFIPSKTTPTQNNARCYFTNTDQMKKSDPFAALGLQWGATATEIKDAYRRLARELHPDVSNLEPEVALDQFRLVKEAYDKLMNNKGNAGIHRTDLWEEWSFQIWRNSDIIAQERTDVAGVSKKRPLKPAESIKRKSWGVASLGHPDGRGTASGRGEYLASGDIKRSSTVGNIGNSKWVSKKKEYQPFTPREGAIKGISQYRNKKRAQSTSKDDASETDGRPLET